MCAAARTNELHSLEASEQGLRSGAKISPMQTMADDRRIYPRLPLNLTVRLKRVGGRPEAQLSDLRGLDISCSGVRFASSRRIEPGTAVDLEIVLGEKRGGADIKMHTAAHVVRVEDVGQPGYLSVAAVFDDITFCREPRLARH